MNGFSLFFSLVFVFSCNLLYSQSYIISGRISDRQTGEYLPMASVYSETLNGGTASNIYGFYSFKLPEGSNSIEFTYVGYKKQTININLTNDTIINIALEPNIELNEVKVFAENNSSRLKSTKVSNCVISAKNLQELPTLLGETDIIKQLRTLPGVNAGAEGVAGLVVRGSGADENLVLYDGVPIYNINHLNSFFSVFNTDAIAHAEMYKGAYPARYGGRISSVIDVRMSEGNKNKLEGKISIGTIASKLTLEGPLIKNKSSFIVSARRTYLDLFAMPVQLIADESERTNYVFDDYNVKVNYSINSKNRLYLSTYFGKDKFYMKEKYQEKYGRQSLQQMDWGNAFASARWNNEIGKQTFLNTTAYLYRYKYAAVDQYSRDANGEQLTGGLKDISNTMLMDDIGLKTSMDYTINSKNQIKTGIEYIYHNFQPNNFNHYEIKVTNRGSGGVNWYEYDTVNTERYLPHINSHEMHAFIENEAKLGIWFKLNAGLHYSAFKADSNFHHFIMPRVSLVYLYSEQLSVKLASGIYSQYTFLVTNPTIGMPTDIWIQSTNGLKPMEGWQTVLGFMYNTSDNLLFSTEVFYKTTQNVTEFKEMVQFDLYNEWNNVLEQGLARNYGFEAMAEYRNEKYSLKASYAHIRALRYFDEINKGEPFYYSFDSPHNINIEANIKFNKNVDLGVNWVYASGKRVTLVEQVYIDPFFNEDLNKYNYSNELGYIPASINNIKIVSERNNHKLPNYHRLDIGINFKKQKKRGLRTWSFGIYNAYNRKNTYYIEAWADGYKNYSITPIIPYAAYSFKF